MKRVLFFILILLVSWITFSFAQSTNPGTVSNQLNYQGELRNAQGEPVADGIYTITFTLYDESAGGVAIWTETQNVQVQQGAFSVELGSITPIDITKINDTGITLGIKVGSDSEMTPRQKILPVMFTLKSKFAKKADDANTLQGKQPTDFAAKTHNHNASEIDTTGAGNLVTKIIAGGGITISGNGTGDVTISVPSVSVGGVVLLNPSANQIIQSPSPTNTPIVIKGAIGQTAPLLDFQDNLGNSKFSLVPGRGLTFTGNGGMSANGNISIELNGTGDKGLLITNPSNNAVDIGHLQVEGGLETLMGLITSPAGKIDIDVKSNSANTSVNILNNDPTYKANLSVEGFVVADNIKANNGLSAMGINNVETAPNVIGTSELTTFYGDGSYLAGVQKQIIGNCAGQVVVGIDNSGNVVCEPDDVGGSDGGSSYVNLTPTALQTIQGTGDFTPLVIKGQIDQTAPLFTVVDGNDVKKFAIMADGHVLIPSNNILHILNMDNDSPLGPMGDMNINVANNIANSKLNILNPDATYTAGLSVEGNVLIGNPSYTSPMLSVKQNGVNTGVAIETSATTTSTALDVWQKGTGSGIVTSVDGGSSPAIEAFHGGTGPLLQLYNSGGLKFEVNNAGNLFVGNPTIKNAKVSVLETGTANSAGYFQIANASNSNVLLYGNSTGTGNLFQLQKSTVDKFTITNAGDLIFGPANPTISATGIGANITLDANDAAVSTVTITNSGTGKANLSVEGVVSAFGGANSVPVTDGNTQQLIQKGTASGTCGSAINVSFPTVFSGTPIVVATQEATSPGPISVSTITGTGFKIYCSGGTINFQWIAIGTK